MRDSQSGFGAALRLCSWSFGRLRDWLYLGHRRLGRFRGRLCLRHRFGAALCRRREFRGNCRLCRHRDLCGNCGNCGSDWRGRGRHCGLRGRRFHGAIVFLGHNLQTSFWRFARGKPSAQKQAERTSAHSSARFPGVNTEVAIVVVSPTPPLGLTVGTVVLRWWTYVRSSRSVFALAGAASGPAASTPAAQPAATSEAAAAPAPEGTGLQPNLAACLACLFSILGGIAFLVLEKKNAYVRFYAMQSAILGGLWVVVCVAFTDRLRHPRLGSSASVCCSG